MIIRNDHLTRLFLSPFFFSFGCASPTLLRKKIESVNFTSPSTRIESNKPASFLLRSLSHAGNFGEERKLRCWKDLNQTKKWICWIPKLHHFSKSSSSPPHTPEGCLTASWLSRLAVCSQPWPRHGAAAACCSLQVSRQARPTAGPQLLLFNLKEMKEPFREKLCTSYCITLTLVRVGILRALLVT